ncbi:hypothetical protein JV173_05475 [Acholeplasma equirhinis]|uniref:hypothetical protein n=1 Tax=Acholeplasma equirhinis TaxID=555393 RepID=UPI00197AA8F0|nr:hypothetical protein [Acholeplasma equirhinis]MBN3490965.1 hypothetical protein [Acholeplasma equirhinis]
MQIEVKSYNHDRLKSMKKNALFSNAFVILAILVLVVTMWDQLIADDSIIYLWVVIGAFILVSIGFLFYYPSVIQRVVIDETGIHAWNEKKLIKLYNWTEIKSIEIESIQLSKYNPLTFKEIVVKNGSETKTSKLLNSKQQPIVINLEKDEDDVIEVIKHYAEQNQIEFKR